MKRRGGVLVMVAAATAMLMAAGAVVVDLGAGVQARTRQQAATDAGALAAAYHLAGRPDAQAATASALDWVARNGEATTADQVALWTRTDGSPAVTVRANKHVDTAFARFFGVDGYDVAVASSAALRAVSEVPKRALPIGMQAHLTPSGTMQVLAEPSACGCFTGVSAGTNFKLELPKDARHLGNVVPLSFEGASYDCFWNTLHEGSTMPTPFGSTVRTGQGDRSDMADALRDRIGDTVMVPLVADNDVVANRSDVHVLGVVAMQITGVAKDGTVTATYSPTVVAAAAAHEANGGGGLGVYAPVLIDTPAAPATLARS